MLSAPLGLQIIFKATLESICAEVFPISVMRLGSRSVPVAVLLKEILGFVTFCLNAAAYAFPAMKIKMSAAKKDPLPWHFRGSPEDVSY